MIGAITAELLAAGPDIWAAIEEAGQDVQILRPHTAPTPARAVLFSLGNGGAGQSNVDADYKVTAWQGIFKPDAPVRERGFIVQSESGQLFWPTSDTQDPAEQGVALITHLLPLPERTRTEYLAFTTAGSGVVRDSVTGNWVPAPTTPLSVPARLMPTADPRIREMVGADVAEVAFVGRWGNLLDPQGRPSGVNWGSASPFMVDGQPGTLTIKLAYPDPDTAQELVLGSRFVALWKAGVT